MTELLNLCIIETTFLLPLYFNDVFKPPQHLYIQRGKGAKYIGLIENKN
jgi:hypothetical protein